VSGQTVTSGNRLGLGAQPGRQERFPVLHPDRCGDQSGQFEVVRSSIWPASSSHNTAIVSRSAAAIGIGFAIPAAMVRVVVDSAKAGSAHVLRPWLGASLQGVTAEIAESMVAGSPQRCPRAQVQKGGPAEAAGLATGDIITSVDGVIISDPEEFGYRFATKPLGGTTVIDVLRAVLIAGDDRVDACRANHAGRRDRGGRVPRR